jgi:hypothetical protein
MCAPSNKPSLVNAVGDLLINEFVTSGKKFSAHDVTQRLRQLELERAKNTTRNVPLPISTGTPVDMAETGEVYSAGYKVPKIEHEDVRAIVHDIFSAGGMPNLVRERSALGYWEYDVPKSAVAVVPVTGSTTDPDPVVSGTTGPTYDGSSTI